MEAKDTREGKIVQEKYGDILPLQRPASSHVRMDVVSRAKIFAPFAALRGYDEELEAMQHRKSLVSPVLLEEESLQELEKRLCTLRRGEKLRITHFVQQEGSLGFYEALEGVLENVDVPFQQLSVRPSASRSWEPALQIAFQDILSLEEL